MSKGTKVNVFKSHLTGGAFQYEGKTPKCLRTGSYIIIGKHSFNDMKEEMSIMRSRMKRCSDDIRSDQRARAKRRRK